MQRVVVTALGLVTPLGRDVETTWAGLCEGRSGVGPITLFDAARFDTRFAGEVKDWDPSPWLDKRKLKECARFTQFAVGAGATAWHAAGLQDMPESERDRVGCIVGVGMGGLEVIQDCARVLFEKGPARLTPYFIPAAISNLAAGQLAMKLGLRGVNYCTTSACASGAHAIGEAARYIQRGEAKVMLAGGAEACIIGMGIGGFNAMKALSTRNEEPARASRPWDRQRDGFVMGEGAGLMVLEEYEHARKRGATILAELVGYGSSDDAHHITQPAPEGEGAQRAMRAALADARVSSDVIGYVNAHGTSTPAGDLQEARALRALFGARVGKVPVSSTKSMIGHLLGAAGGVEAVFTVLALQRGVLPPTINLEEVDPECADLDLVPNTAREAKVDFAMSNAFGFGGTNSTLIFKRA